MEVTIKPRGMDTVQAAAASGGGRAVSSLGELVAVDFSHRYEEGFGGEDLAKCVVDPTGPYVGGMFRPGDPYTIRSGGGTCWEGSFSEALPTADGKVELHGRGNAYSLLRHDCVHFEQVDGDDDLYYPTTDFEDGLDFARAYPEWQVPINQIVGTLPSGAYGTDAVAAQPVKLATVLTAHCTAEQKFWEVRGSTLIISTPPTEPTYVFTAPTSVVGVADTDFRSHVGIWCIPADASPAQTIVWVGFDSPTMVRRFGSATEVIDYRDQGGVDLLAMQTMAAGRLELVAGRWVFTGSITVGRDEGLTTLAGGAVPIEFVRAGRRLLLPQMRTSQGTLMPDGGNGFVIGRTEFSWSKDGDPRLTITPQGSSARDIPSLLAPPSKDAGSQMVNPAA